MEDELRPEIAKRIKMLRESRGYSIRAFARIMGVSPGTAHKWESGTTANMENATLLKVAHALRTDPYYLVFGVSWKIPTEELPVLPDAPLDDTSATGRFLRRTGK